MSANESAVMMVLPDDNLDTLVRKLHTTSAGCVQLLVPDGVSLLHSSHVVDALRRSIEPDQITLIVISSDEQTLDTARKFELETIAVYGARVAVADIATAPPPTPPPASSEPAAPAASVRTNDIPPLDEAEYDPFADELDSLSDMLSGRTSTPDEAEQQAADFADELDSLSDMFDEGDARSARESKPASAAAPPRPRIRPEDIVLSDAEKKQAASVRVGGGRRQTEKANTGAGGGLFGLGRFFKKTPPPEGEDEAVVKPAGISISPSPLSSILPVSMPLLIGVVVVVLVVFGIAMFMLGRATVEVSPPAVTTQIIPFQEYPVPIAGKEIEASDTAVRAEVVSTQMSASVTGQVAQQTMSPGTPARGTVTLYNQGYQAVGLPRGTEFIGTNAEGQEVTFTTDEDATVPPASTVSQGHGFTVNFGRTSIPVTARVAGRNSNIAAGTITHFATPGQGRIALGGGVLRVEHGAMSGGQEKEVYVIKSEDVRPALSDALNRMYNDARQQLGATAEQAGLILDAATIYPDPQSLAERQGFILDVQPPEGTTLEHGREFTLQVEGNFTALATPPDAPELKHQVVQVVPNLLISSGAVTPGLALQPHIETTRWDGSRLTVDGTLEPADAATTLDPPTRLLIINAIRGKPYDEARAAMEEFKQRGIISHYVLPNKEQFPEWDIQLTLKVVPADQIGKNS